MEFNDFSVSGRVIDASGNPISGVKVTLQEKGQTLSVTTYSTGSYEFKNLGMGVKNLTYFHNSYKTETRSVEARYYYEEKVADVVLERIPEPNPLEALAESMVFVEGGTFQMGGTYSIAKPVHSVTLSDFYIGKYEVTQAQWKAVMGKNPSNFTGDDNRPVEQVSWEDVQEFIQKLNVKTGKRYRLPTEAEWEYAARGGKKSQGYYYAGSHATDEVAWHYGNSGDKTHPVGQKQPNELGLYDMSGNVMEWCQDWYGDYSSSAQTNPTGPSSGSVRVHRGGSWCKDAEYCRVAFRDYGNPISGLNDRGFRLVEGELPPQEDPEVDPLEALAESMVFVAGGTFQMGATSEQESDAYDGERPVHAVTLNDFYIGKYEVTQAQWKAVMGSNQSWFTGDDNLPVEEVSWEEVQEFIKKLNALTGKTYRLPTEAEWEYAARGGKKSLGYKYAGSNTVGDVAWYWANSGYKTHPVGQKQPNELGLYDMSGNVEEWCQDWYGGYPSSAQTNPTGPSSGSYRVLRGGHWGSSARDCRVAFRNNGNPSYGDSFGGFRLVEGELPPQEDPEVDPLEALAESMVFVEGGTFQMGATSEQDTDAQENEKPVHSVTLSDFYIGKYEVTQAQWKAVMGEDPIPNTSSNNYPRSASWDDIQTFITKLNEITGKTYRLPTEAEWEYAARGGKKSEGNKFAGSNEIDEVAWYYDNGEYGTHPIGQKLPNELGLYDMSGNVMEWCQDWYAEYTSASITNPRGGKTGNKRIIRGGYYISDVEYCRISARASLMPTDASDGHGFRLVEGELPPQEDPEEDPLEALAESMVFVAGGTFQMGATSEQGSDVQDDEKPVHSVTLSDFYIGKYEVTQAQWKAVMGSNPSSLTGDDNLPVEHVRWNDVQEFIQKLNAKTGKTYRLPTEAEWEYAARGGKKSLGYTYAGSNTVGDVAWYEDNSGDKTQPVGQKQPNELGLYDMSGNVWEWCQDWYGDYSSSAQTNPTGPSSGTTRVLRGGSWNCSAWLCRVSLRFNAVPSDWYLNFGFRLVEGELPPQEDPEVDPLEALAESMVFVEGGTFQMGATSEQGSDADADEKPVHSVTLSDFYIGKYEVTQGQWRAVMGNNPSYFTGDDNLPVEQVSWDDVQEFIQKLNQLTGKTYRLPTEAEWEYAARGGNQSRGYKYAGSNTLEEVAWYSGNSDTQTHLVGQKQANELGLYDMSGNVEEWCQDWYGAYSYSSQTNPTGPASNNYRVIRGAYWGREAKHCRVSSRSFSRHDFQYSGYGFRLVEGELPQQEDPEPEVDPLEALAESMVFVEGGTFQMGATAEQEANANASKQPGHSVTLSDFYIGKYEVTQAQWTAVMGNNPSSFKEDNLPVGNVSWDDIQEFIQKLNQLTGKTYRLPTEAEWEYAARGGNQSRGYKYAGSNTLEEVAWYYDNDNSHPHPVGEKQANELGLYDMSGNVWEWCQDWYGAYSSSSQTNPAGPGSGEKRVKRGGAFNFGASVCSVSHRGLPGYPSYKESCIGFRLVEGELPPQKDPEVDPLEALAASMVFVEGGTFQMGATEEQGADADSDEYPVHSVTLNDFYIGKYEVTEAQWTAVMGNNPSYYNGDINFPVNEVSWDDIQEFIQKLNQLTGKTYRLPTEAEWEYAARGGKKSKGYKYAGSNTIEEVAWYSDNSDSHTHPVGQMQPNELGLYDMSGNVMEWCQDWYGHYSDYYQPNPTGPGSGSSRVCRGGGWYFSAQGCRVSFRRNDSPSYNDSSTGFRLVEGELPPQNEVDPLEALAESMVFVEGGTFQMGATEEQGADFWPYEKPVHSVTLSDFYIGKYEVTQAQWTAVMGNNPSSYKGDILPVEGVSWDKIQEFIQKLNQLTGKTYRLPTEAEWEYAARGGKKSKGYKYAGSNTLKEVAWYDGNSDSHIHPVGQMQANELGLYDMSGNVYEWCQDWYGEYSSSSQTNPSGPSSGEERVFRGGSFFNDAFYCRVSFRSSHFPSYNASTRGFRLVMVP